MFAGSVYGAHGYSFGLMCRYGFICLQAARRACVAAVFVPWHFHQQHRHAAKTCRARKHQTCAYKTLPIRKSQHARHSPKPHPAQSTSLPQFALGASKAKALLCFSHHLTLGFFPRIQTAIEQQHFFAARGLGQLACAAFGCACLTNR